MDYARLAKRWHEIAELASALATFGPESTPAALRDDDARLAYYVDAYNLLVIHAVLHQRAPIGARGARPGRAGAGHGVLDGTLMSLHGLENDVMRARFDDARLHAAIVCASASCPSLAPDAHRAATLDAQLARAARDFAESPHVRVVRVDDEAGVVELSSIYEWYAPDFVEHARALGGDPSVLGWIALHAPDPSAIERARAGGYEVRSVPYNWSLNGHW